MSGRFASSGFTPTLEERAQASAAGERQRRDARKSLFRVVVVCGLILVSSLFIVLKG